MKVGNNETDDGGTGGRLTQSAASPPVCSRPSSFSPRGPARRGPALPGPTAVAGRETAASPALDDLDRFRLSHQRRCKVMQDNDDVIKSELS